MHGYTPVLCTQTPGGTSEDEFIQALVDRDVAGIVFVSGLHADTTASHERYVRLLAHSVPIVLINGFADNVPAPFFSTDDRSAMRLAVATAPHLGHEPIGLAVGPRRFVPVLRKSRAFSSDDAGAGSADAAQAGRALAVRSRAAFGRGFSSTGGAPRSSAARPDGVGSIRAGRERGSGA